MQWLRTLVLLLLAVSPAWANVGPRSWGGAHAGDLVGITDVAITHEELVIDLAPIAGVGSVTGGVVVSATYHLDNTGTAKHLDLVFATGSTSDIAFHATLDKAEVPTAVVGTGTLPASWLPPKSTPLADGTALSYDLRDAATPTGFSLDVPPGKHELAITYRARAMGHHADSPTLMYQFAYVLSPARAWAAFGGLDVTVKLPPGWLAAVTPALTRDGDTLRGTFKTVPADALAITVQAPFGMHSIVRVIVLGVFALVGIGGLIVVGWLSRKRGGSAWSYGGAWGSAVLVAGLVALNVPDLTLPAGEADHYGYGNAFATFALVVLAIVAVPIGAAVARVARR